MKSKQPAFEIAICCVSILAFAVWLGKYINLDFWYDELITLQYFVFVPVQKIVTDYSVPNNHIFFNILNHLFMGVLGVANLPALMDHPFWIRSLMAFYTAVTLIYLYRIGVRFYNRTVAVAAVIILLTTLPFYNFAVQVRGYSLSMALATMLSLSTPGALRLRPAGKTRSCCWRRPSCSCIRCRPTCISLEPCCC